MGAVLFDLGVIRIYWYSVIMFLAILIGGAIILRESKKFNVPENFMINLFFFMIPLSIIGARLYYVGFNWDYYSENLFDIIKTWEGGLAIHGAIIVGLIWVVFYTKRYNVRTLRIMDFMTLGLIIGQAIGRWGNFFNGEAHGPATSLEVLQKLHIPNFIIEGMNIGGVYYHPTFFYESLWCLIGFIVILIIKRYKYIKIGHIASIYFIWYGIGRFLIENLRTDSLMIGNFKIAQIVSFTMIVVGLIMLLVLNKGSRFKNQYNEMSDVNETRF